MVFQIFESFILFLKNNHGKSIVTLDSDVEKRLGE